MSFGDPLKYKAISLHQPWANLIRDKIKQIETRFWKTDYRGDLVICSTKSPEEGDGPFGHAICIVSLVDCIPMEKYHEESACIEWKHDRWAWMLENIRKFKTSFPVKGKQGFFRTDIPEWAWNISKIDKVLNLNT